MSKRSRKGGKKTAYRHLAKHRKPSTGGHPSRSAFPDREFRILSLASLFLVAWIAYANALHNSLAFDDVAFATGSGLWNLDLPSIGRYFTSDVWASTGNQSGLYRPLFLLVVAAEVNIFGDWYVGHHLVNVLLHSLVALALFSLVRYLLSATGSAPRPAAYAALLSALIFVVHPINTEVVNSIFNRSGMLVTLGVVAGLCWFLPKVKNFPRTAWAGISLLYLLILFCKETAIMFPAIIIATLLFDTPGNWQTRLRKCIPVVWMILPVVLFFAFRSIALSPAETPGALAQTIAEVVVEQAVADVPVEQTAAEAPQEQATAEAPVEQTGESALSKVQLGFNPDKITAASKVWFDGLVKMVWPQPLLAFHEASTTNLWLALAVQSGLLALALIAFLRRYPGPLLGLVIFYLGLLPSSRIFSASAVLPHLAERYLYLPAVGLTISLAFVLYWLLQKFSPRWVAPFLLIPALVLTPLTWARNADWASTVSIAQSDYDKGSRNLKNLGALITGLIFEGEYARARKLCDKHADRFVAYWYLSATCGQVYEQSGLTGKAEKAYLFSLKNNAGRASGHYSLALLYHEQSRNAEAEEQFKQAIAAEQQQFMKEILSAEMLMALYPHRRSRLLEAKDHLETAAELQPQFHLSQTKLAELNEMLRVAKDD
jgi:tetratricopeptide (TPR) repeat protein